MGLWSVRKRDCAWAAQRLPSRDAYSQLGLPSLVPRPRPPGEGKGLVTIARFLVCAESAVLFSRQPIRLLGLKISCDIKRP